VAAAITQFTALGCCDKLRNADAESSVGYPEEYGYQLTSTTPYIPVHAHIL